MTATVVPATDKSIPAARPLVIAGLVSLALHGGVLAAASWLWTPTTAPQVPALVAVTVIAESLVRPKIKPQSVVPEAKPESPKKKNFRKHLRAMKRTPQQAPEPVVPSSVEAAAKAIPLPEPVWGDALPVPPHPPRFRVRKPARQVQLKPTTPDPRADKPPLVKVTPVIAAPGHADRDRQIAKAIPSWVAGATAPPRPVAGLGNAPPQYPWISRRRGEQGRVVLAVAVTADGHAAAVRVKQTSGSSRLDQAALAAVKRWQFSPAMRGGRAVAGRIDVPVAFRLTP